MLLLLCMMNLTRRIAVSSEMRKIEALQKLTKVDFFTIESIKFSNAVTYLDQNKMIHALVYTKLCFRESGSYLGIILLLSGDVEVQPGPNYYCEENCKLCNLFKGRGIHLIHLNINSLLPKIDEVRQIAKCSKANIIGITETKLDQSISNTEIEIEGYSVIRKDRSRHGGGISCYISKNICFNEISVFNKDIENIFVDILLPKSKPFTVGFFYRHPNQNNFLDLVYDDFHKLNPERKEIYILGDMNINVLVNGKSYLDKDFKISDRNITAQSKKYKEFCSYF